MIVKQISIDIEVSDSNIDLEEVVESLLIEKGFNLLGIDQNDISEAYSKHCNKQS